MNDLVPFFGFNVVSESDLIVINTYADDASFVLPFFFVLNQHILVVLHRSLTGWTPGCPEVDEQNLVLLPV